MGCRCTDDGKTVALNVAGTGQHGIGDRLIFVGDRIRYSAQNRGIIHGYHINRQDTFRGVSRAVRNHVIDRILSIEIRVGLIAERTVAIDGNLTKGRGG